MSKIGQHYMDLLYVETSEPDLDQDPGYIKWAAEQDDEDIQVQDGDTNEPF
ncbi:MAG: hypothetical protein GY941_05005 [Planctomycetes bacterium]|nr:hypothetical protein [Planctomycetota bacterium]